jgi:hypothetical protein
VASHGQHGLGARARGPFTATLLTNGQGLSAAGGDNGSGPSPPPPPRPPPPPPPPPPHRETSELPDALSNGGGTNHARAPVFHRIRAAKRVIGFLTWGPSLMADRVTVSRRNKRLLSARPTDDGETQDNLGTHTGTFTYQVSVKPTHGDCSRSYSEFTVHGVLTTST